MFSSCILASRNGANFLPSSMCGLDLWLNGAGNTATFGYCWTVFAQCEGCVCFTHSVHPSAGMLGGVTARTAEPINQRDIPWHATSCSAIKTCVWGGLGLDCRGGHCSEAAWALICLVWEILVWCLVSQFCITKNQKYINHYKKWPPSLSQVPLVVFKREKEVARKLEFDGLYITEQPTEDDIKGQWDRLVINTP